MTADQCLFIDDLKENCEGADAVGMTSVRFESAPKAISRLTELTGVALTASP